WSSLTAPFASSSLVWPDAWRTFARPGLPRLDINHVRPDCQYGPASQARARGEPGGRVLPGRPGLGGVRIEANRPAPSSWYDAGLARKVEISSPRHPAGRTSTTPTIP